MKVTKEQIEGAREVFHHWNNTATEGNFANWLDDKLKPKDETFERFKELYNTPLKDASIHGYYKSLREDVFADELSQTKGLDMAIAKVEKMAGASRVMIINELTKIKDRLTKGDE